MLADAQQGEQLIAIVLLKEGWDENYFGNPPIHQVAGMGKLTHVKRLQSGRYFVQLVGLCRVRIERELDLDAPYRSASVSVMEDQVDALTTVRAGELRDQALASFNSMLKTLTEFPGELLNTGRRLPAGLTLDILANHLPSDPQIKQQLLEETSVVRRGQMMIRLAERLPTLLPSKVKARFRVFPKPSQN